MVTGTSIERMLVERYKWLHKFGIRIQAPSRDASASVGFDLFGKGQLLILASHCSRRDVARQLADGYRLEHLDKVQEQLAKSMQVPQSYLVSIQHRATPKHSVDFDNCVGKVLEKDILTDSFLGSAPSASEGTR